MGVSFSRRTMMSAAVLAALIVVAFPGVAGAIKPTKTTISGPTSVADTSLCGFPLTIESQVNGSQVVHYYTDGSVSFIQYHLVESDVFQGKNTTLSGLPFRYNGRLVFDRSGQLVHVYDSGFVEKIVLPDGTLFKSVGRIDFVTFNQDFAITPQVGLSGDVAAFCAAFG
jgi:hypothetical protein